MEGMIEAWTAASGIPQKLRSVGQHDDVLQDQGDGEDDGHRGAEARHRLELDDPVDPLDDLGHRGETICRRRRSRALWSGW